MDETKSVYSGGEWVVDAAEIMDGAVDEAEAMDAASAADPAAEGPEGGERFELKRFDERLSVGRDEVVTLAQKGLDYDRVRAKLESARDELADLRGWLESVSGGKGAEEFRDELSARALAEREGVDFDTALENVRRSHAGQTGSDGAALRRRREVREFFSAHPDVAARMVTDRGAIPDEVWSRVRAGESLKDAFEAHALRAEAEDSARRVRELERELAETRQAGVNAQRSTLSASSAGGDAPADAVELGWRAV